MQMLGNLKQRGDNQDMNITIATELRGRLRDPRNPDQLFLGRNAIGNWVTPAATATLDPTSASLGALAAAVRAAVLAAPERAVLDIHQLADLAAKGVLGDVLPAMDLFSVDKQAHFTNWEWRGAALAFAGGPPPLLHTGAVPTMPARNSMSIVRPMVLELSGGRMINCFWSDAIASEVLSSGLKV